MSGIHPEDLLARLIHGPADPAPQRLSKDEPPACNHWTAPVLLERAAWLRRMARAGQGSASDTLKDLPGYCATLWVRLRPAPAERHDRDLTVLLVLDGKATLNSGGTLQDPRSAAPAQFTGSAIDRGASTDLRPGDVLHLAPGTPFQLLVPNEKPLSYLQLSLRPHKEENREP